ncbi:hypothetical protein MHPYR_80090 [uncultured Mycobacterium sp.]|uniref:Uncharacterized protein n=1 Tax=uncultured Mycobacterium sp. TaxID=171292 RepID=A0A1Y5PTI1_9MYCO|nr:hypothetical protein MHPYR_80090 [uncultured Mycobacterium sp.]
MATRSRSRWSTGARFREPDEDRPGSHHDYELLEFPRLVADLGYEYLQLTYIDAGEADGFWLDPSHGGINLGFPTN